MKNVATKSATTKPAPTRIEAIEALDELQHVCDTLHVVTVALESGLDERAATSAVSVLMRAQRAVEATRATLNGLVPQ